MSRTHNERSVPNARGRKGEMKAKRRSHRRARGVVDIEDVTTIKYKSSKEMLDRNTKQKDMGPY